MADKGDTAAAHALGILFEYGAAASGLNKNEAEALSWYARSRWLRRQTRPASTVAPVAHAYTAKGFYAHDP
jgi:hypothetical protein